MTVRDIARMARRVNVELEDIGQILDIVDALMQRWTDIAPQAFLAEARESILNLFGIQSRPPLRR